MVRSYAKNQYRILSAEYFNSPRLCLYQAIARSVRQHFNLENGLDIVNIENSGNGEINNLVSCRNQIELILNEIVALREDADYDRIIIIYGTANKHAGGSRETFCSIAKHLAQISVRPTQKQTEQ